MDLRQHGQLPEPSPQITGAFEGICVDTDVGDVTVTFVIPSVSSDLVYGPAPFCGPTLPDPGDRLLAVFASNGRPWVLGSTTQP